MSSSLDGRVPLMDKPENMDLVNYLLYTHDVNSNNYWRELQAAIWTVTDHGQTPEFISDNYQLLYLIKFFK